MDPDRLISVLERARSLGFLGPGPVTDHVDHARAFVREVPDSARVLDLGSGGGVPGLIVAVERPASELVLVDSMTRRGEFLEWAISQLELSDRVRVLVERAESAARVPDLRHAFEVVTSRSFGPPSVTAECAVGFLREPEGGHSGGVLLVSEPPTSTVDRWPTTVLDQLGLADDGLRPGVGPRVRRLRSIRSCDERFPRRVGLPAKRPLS